MKRVDLKKYLLRNGCEFLREGGNHSIYVNRSNNKVSSIPRHNEIFEYLAVKICKDLEIPIIRK